MNWSIYILPFYIKQQMDDDDDVLLGLMQRQSLP